MRATEIASRLASQCDAVCQHLLPAGRQHGADWCCGSLGGEPGDSLKIRLAGAKAGVWADFGGSGDDRGDLIGLWQRVRNVDLHTACEEAMDWLNIPASQREAHAPNEYTRPTKIETRAPSDTWVRLQQQMRRGTITELSALADLRKIPSIAGLELATSAGQLWFADVFDDGFEWPSWIITDGSRRNAQARRIDGKPWSGIGNKKAKTIAGCEARWPVGAPEVGTKDFALVEGGPDFLAASFGFTTKRVASHPSRCSERRTPSIPRRFPCSPAARRGCSRTPTTTLPANAPYADGPTNLNLSAPSAMRSICRPTAPKT